MPSVRLHAKIVLERLRWVRQMVLSIQNLPLDTLATFTADPRTPAAAESYLRRGLEALLDLGRHLLAKGYGQAVSEYKAIAHGLGSVGVLDAAEVKLLREMAGYRNRMVHFYDKVSVEELYEICTEGLTDIERIVATLERWIREHPERIDQAL
jgi:uncharacterized protein YutE (UPF0331/DUF86 family)